MSRPGGVDFGEVVMEMMAVIGIAAVVDNLTTEVRYLDVQDAWIYEKCLCF